MDRRWQLVLDCLESEKAPLGKGTLVRFRAAAMAKGLDRKLVEKTVKMAEEKGGYSSRSLRVALDSSPLWGAARVEDTYNLLGHALRKALEVIARHQQQDLATVAQQVDAEILTQTSLKAALDLDWDDPEARSQALAKILQTLNEVETWVEQSLNPDETITAQVNQNLATARQIEDQDVEATPKELHIERAYLTCHWVKERSEDLTIICKAWRVFRFIRMSLCYKNCGKAN